MCQSDSMSDVHSRKGEASPSHFSFENMSVIKAFNIDKMEDPSCAFAQFGDKVTIKWLTVGGICI
jgi:hypothetical protein